MKRFYLKTIGRILPTDLFAPRFPVSLKGICLIDGKVILVQNEHDEWDLPGGKLGTDESLQQCLVREMKEELGIWVKPAELIDMLKVRVRGLIDVLVPVYTCTTEASCDDLILSAEHFKVRCFDLNELSQLIMAADYGPLIRKALAKGAEPLPV